jgi:FKBP-type peptidyl-prolyl cis-trans isomerase
MVLLSWKQKTAGMLAATGLLWALVAPSWAEEKADAGMVIADGKQISLEFTLSLDDKTKVQSNIGQEPMVYLHGSQQIIPGLEKQLTGLKVGDTKHVEISPEDGWSSRPKADAGSRERQNPRRGAQNWCKADRAWPTGTADVCGGERGQRQDACSRPEPSIGREEVDL